MDTEDWMQIELTAVFREAPEGGYVAFVEDDAAVAALMRLIQSLP